MWTLAEAKRDSVELEKGNPGCLWKHPGLYVVPGAGLEPARCLAPADFESAASTNFATPAGGALVEQDAYYDINFGLSALMITT